MLRPQAFHHGPEFAAFIRSTTDPLIDTLANAKLQLNDYNDRGTKR